MIDPISLLGFATVSLAIAISPGPSWLYVISTTVRHSRRGGFVAMLGNAMGILCHVLAAALGLSAVLSYSATAYATIQWIGACYLVYLGVRTLVQKSPSENSPRPVGLKSLGKIYRDGVLVNVLNPKVAVLMLALLPQFVDPARGNIAMQTVLVGMIHVLIASLVLTTLVWIADRSTALIQSSQTTERIFRWVSGSVLVGLGARLALAGRG